jgi:hypothetical protein
LTTIDTIRAVFTYIIALTIVVGGGYILFETRTDPSVGDFRAVVAGFIGAAVTFAFQQETQTRTARQSNTAATTGATLHANGIAGTPVVTEPVEKIGG